MKPKNQTATETPDKPMTKPVQVQRTALACPCCGSTNLHWMGRPDFDPRVEKMEFDMECGDCNPQGKQYRLGMRFVMQRTREGTLMHWEVA